MNKELICTQNSVFVNTDNGIQKRQNTGNIEEILITENNIEEIEKKIRYIENKIVGKEYKKLLNKLTLKYLKWSLLLTLPPILLAALLATLAFNLITIIKLIQIITIFIFGYALIPTTLASIKTKNIYKSYSKKQLKLLFDELKTQKQKLNELNNNKNLNNIIYKQNSLKKIEKSKLIKDLKRKLELIEEYQKNIKQYGIFAKDYFNSVKLKKLGYSESDIDFIHTLIEEDYKIKNKNEKTYKKL